MRLGLHKIEIDSDSVAFGIIIRPQSGEGTDKG